MGSVIKLKASYAIRFDIQGSTKEKRKQKQIGGFKTQREAKKALLEIENKVNKNTYILEEIKLNDFFNIWLSDHVSKLSPKTQVYYEGLFKNYIEPYFEGLYIQDLKPNVINKFYDHLRKHATDDIAFKSHKTLRACLNIAYKWNYIETKIMDKVTPPSEPPANRNFWDDETIKKALLLLKDSKVYFHIYLALNLGLRLGETCALTTQDIDFNKKTITVNKTLQYVKKQIVIKNTKTISSKRVLPLTDNNLKFIQDHINNIKKDKLYNGNVYNYEYNNFLSVFNNGDIQSDSYVTKRFKKDLIKTDLPVIKFHDLRHSCASWLIHNDVDLKTVQEILGHSDFSTTANIYAHVTQSKKLEAFKKLN